MAKTVIMTDLHVSLSAASSPSSSGTVFQYVFSIFNFIRNLIPPLVVTPLENHSAAFWISLDEMKDNKPNRSPNDFLKLCIIAPKRRASEIEASDLID